MRELCMSYNEMMTSLNAVSTSSAAAIEKWFGMTLLPEQVEILDLLDSATGLSRARPRRSGKTILLCAYAVYRALSHPDTRVGYVVQNRYAKRYANDQIKRFIELSAEPYMEEAPLVPSRITLHNRSTIQVIGADEPTRAYNLDVLCIDEIPNADILLEASTTFQLYTPS
jgi:hypothetical protein